jgi:hypothetical protein
MIRPPISIFGGRPCRDLAVTMPFFANSRRFIVEDGTFNDAGRDIFNFITYLGSHTGQSMNLPSPVKRGRMFPKSHAASFWENAAGSNDDGLMVRTQNSPCLSRSRSCQLFRLLNSVIWYFTKSFRSALTTAFILLATTARL